jgi:hypothetical protein
MLRSASTGFIEPCLPSPADKPPSGSSWIHEIKHDGFRLMARRDPVGIRLVTRNGHDWAGRYPLVVAAVNHLQVRSCLIDGEVACCYERGLATFHLHRHRRNEPQALGLACRSAKLFAEAVPTPRPLDLLIARRRFEPGGPVEITDRRQARSKGGRGVVRRPGRRASSSETR